ncbi:alpha-glucosidase [Clostridium botulinum]|uniref:Oligo-1,6-glucosidase n=1 Tax=Clostridium botulinum (strain Eklund 17B / Type B) TaxID=935198 RepID=B2THZ4_CLOBB|nr:MULTISPECIES: alpha-glucosidase [unclassified Clostridium]ACD24877.1 oligo-1,6-glucosidase [Clostridium botulinum B str. Eklund 17B (NRP)]MBN1053846.1 alpha-glucosidase [Clostridium botulinum]MBY6977331.1 alpha-glucosidase [Clostridium botulinum]MBY7001887.1 alpha-glucosidase [Clostridium botulinum]MCR1275668.1 alpha-glucosidase [Clostridium botulinum]
MKTNWWKESVVYQIYPRSFKDSNGDGIGDIRGIIEKLDYLRELGIDVIWLSPVYKSPNDDNGYDISDYKDIMTEFGTMNDFDELLKSAHEKGIKIMMDLVVNHTSDEHKWFVESRKSENNKYRDYYVWKKGKDGQPPNNWTSCFSGSAWQYDEETDMYYLHLFSKKQPDLNWENPELRSDVYSMMQWWLGKGIDGFRMDVINFISKNQEFPDGVNGDFSKYSMNGPRIHEFLEEINEKVLRGKNLITVGEMPGVSVEEAKLYTGEDRNELNMVFQFEHTDLGNGKYGKWHKNSFKLTDLKKIMTKWQKGLENEGWNSLYWNNHDQPRVVSRFGNDKKYWKESAKMLATCLHMMKGTPYIYQGEEIGMTNVTFRDLNDYKDIEIINAYNDLVIKNGRSHDEMMEGIHDRGRDNARTPMQWNSSVNAGFTTGTPWIKVNPNYNEINAESQINDKDSIFNYYKELIKIRKDNEIIVYGNYDLILEDSEEIYAYVRTLNEEQLLVICNFSSNTSEFKLPNNINSKYKKLLIANYDECKEETLENISLRPYECRAYLI